MIGEKILKKRHVSINEVKELLTKRKAEKELTYEQDTSLKYAKNFSKLTEKQSKKIYAELMEIKGMTERLAIKIIDILPKDIEVMKILPLKEEEITNEALTTALEIVKKYRK